MGTPQVTLQVAPQVGKVLLAVRGEMPRSELMAAVGITDRKRALIRSTATGSGFGTAEWRVLSWAGVE